MDREFKNLKVTSETHERVKKFGLEVSFEIAKHEARFRRKIAPGHNMTQDEIVNYLLDEYDRTHIAESIRRSKLKSK